MEHILVTGGAGFIGSHLCDFLIKKGHKVTVLDNFITGDRRNIEHLLDSSAFSLVEHDITDPFETSTKLDAVMHFASPASPMDYANLPLETMRANTLGTENALETAAANGAVFLLASTSEIYGDPLVHPQTEDYWGNVNPIGPRSVYDEAKRYAETLTVTYSRVRNVQTRIVRIFNTYGPRMRTFDGRIVPTMVCQALANEPITVFGDGLQTRSYCYVSDEVEGIYGLLQSDANARPVNIGNPQEISVIDFAREIITLTGSRSEIVHKELPVEDPKKRRPDITLAKSLFGFEPKTGLEEGLSLTIKYFRDVLSL